MKRLFTICLVLLLCTSAYATKVSSRDDSTAIATMQTDVDAGLILDSDELALLGAGPGNVFYVNSNVSAGSGTGLDWTNAKTTIELAIGACTANAGDFIVCAPYHVETASTGTFDLAKDGITLIGLGKGDAQTTITYDTTTDTVIMGASGDGCTIRNIKFYTALDNVASAIVVEDGCTDYVIEDCVFEATSTNEFLDTIYIHGTAANEGIIRRNRFLGDIASNTAPQSSIGFEDAHWLQIYDNEFSGDMGVAHIENKTTASNFITIRDNRFLCGFIGADSTNLDTVPGITLFATTTGWIQDNFIVTNVSTPDDAIVAADCYLSGNTYTEKQGSANSAVQLGTAFGPVGSKFIVVVDVNSSLLPNGTQSAAAITTTSSGALVLEDISISTDSTGFAGPTNIEFTCDNTYGLTGANGILLLEAVAGLGANLCWTSDEATTEELPFHLESGKKIFLHGDSGAGTGDKIQKVILYFRRVDAGATIAALSPAPG